MAGMEWYDSGIGFAIPLEQIEQVLPRLKKGEHYRDDLLGFEVRNVEGVVLGKVDYFADLPTGTVMVVKGAREHWVPTADRKSVV